MNNDFYQGVIREISKANYQIENYSDQKIKYENLKNKINNELIPKLKAAKNWSIEAKEKLISSYDSQEAKKRSKNLQESSEKIDTIINMLNKVIIPQINADINSAKIHIENAKSDLNKYKNML